MKLKSIFDSYSEKVIFNRLKTYWDKYVDIFPQIPLKSIIGYDEILKLGYSKKKVDFLLKTSFDFVICEEGTGMPILVIEFDGIGGGFSNGGKYIIDSTPKTDKYRELKMDAKLKICEKFNLPVVVLSYQESDILKESEDFISILDVIIGDAIEKNHLLQNHGIYNGMISDALQEGFEDMDIVIDTLKDLSNPIKQKIHSITKDFPTWPMQILFPKIENNYMKGLFSLNSGMQSIDGQTVTKKLVTVEVKMRCVGIFKDDSFFMFNTIGEYCLARKTQKELGYDLEKWNDRLQNTPWTKM